MTFVAVARDEQDAITAGTALRALGRHHPSRNLILRPEPDAVASLDAKASLFTFEEAGHEINFEELTLHIGGQAAKHLDSFAEAFTISDLPVVIWYVGTLPDPADPLLSVATALLVDSRDAAGSGRLRSLLDLSRQQNVVDLSWARLRPYRAMLAGLFAEPGRHDLLRSVKAVEVRGKAGPRHVLAGWIAAQLKLSTGIVRIIDDRHVSIAVSCTDGDADALFEVGRVPGTRTLEASAALAGGAPPPRRLALAEDPLAAALADVLVHLEPDPIWQRALASAVLLDD